MFRVGDLQIPYEDKRAVKLFFDVMKKWKPDAINVTGDIDDQLEYSSYSDGTTDEFFNQLKKMENPSPLHFIKKNADGAREFYTKLRSDHKNADIDVQLGNHCIRIFKYVDKKSPEFKDQVTPEFLWGLDSLGMTYSYYHEKPKERFANIYVHHGVTTSSSGPAVLKDIDNYGVSLVRGHDHVGAVVNKSYPLAQKKLQGMSTGHMCDPDAYGLKYTINHAWDLGFGIAHVSNGYAHLQFIPVTKDYECFVDGRLFRG